jgi:hypothetical protein
MPLWKSEKTVVSGQCQTSCRGSIAICTMVCYLRMPLRKSLRIGGEPGRGVSVLALAGSCKSGRVYCDGMSGDSRGKSTFVYPVACPCIRRIIWSETSALELSCPLLDTTRIRSRGLGSGGAAETSQSGGAYLYAKRVYLCTRGNAEMLSLCKEGLSIYKWVMQRCYHYAKRACLYTSG